MTPKSLFWLVASFILAAAPGHSQINTVRSIAPGVYFHEGDPSMGPTCNNGWIVMDDYVVVIDANYPAGARVVIPKIQATTSEPIRFVVDTHFHPDHASGNEVWAELGAIPVAHIATLDELKRSGKESWAESSKSRADVAASKLKLPSLVYTDALIFDDGKHRVELHWMGIGHTRGDTLVWLPHEKILFTGDVCVNGSYNYLHDSNVTDWIILLEKAASLGAEKVCPGHGPMGGSEIIADQHDYFVGLRQGVQEMINQGATLEAAKRMSPGLADKLRKNTQISRYVPTNFWFEAQVAKLYEELDRRPMPAR